LGRAFNRGEEKMVREGKKRQERGRNGEIELVISS
jgi:hypothetical protein